MTDPTCKIDDCDSSVRTRGWCSLHYQRWWKHGDPLVILGGSGVCEACGITIVRASLRGGIPRFCSTTCRSAQYEAPPRPSSADRTPKVCSGCHEEFTPARTAKQAFCTKTCYRRHARANETGECSHDDCDRPVRAKEMCNKHYKAMLYATGRVLPDPWSDRRRDAYHRRRALKAKSSTGDPVLRDEIAERDGYVCGLCMGPVDMAIKWPDRMSATIDHIVPLSRGGAHDPTNAQLSHLTCNAAKRDRVA